MAMKGKAKTGVEEIHKEVKVKPVTERTVAVSFRTKMVQKKKAEKIFDDMGISMSAALNMFLAQVVREKGMPFTPSAVKRVSEDVKGRSSGLMNGQQGTVDEDEAGFMALEELWNEL